MGLATGLIADAEIRDGGDTERGPWPSWWRITLAGAVLIAAATAWLILRRRTRSTPARPAKRPPTDTVPPAPDR